MTIIQDEWIDIASAPKDGTLVDLWLDRPEGVHGMPAAGWRITDVFWRDGWQREFDDGELRPIHPQFVTHWMPRPKPPQTNPAALKVVKEGEGG